MDKGDISTKYNDAKSYISILRRMTILPYVMTISTIFESLYYNLRGRIVKDMSSFSKIRRLDNLDRLENHNI